MDQAYIHDGYTKTVYIAAMEGQYPAVHFEYRAMLSQDRAAIMRKISVYGDARKEETLAAATIAEYVTAWDITKTGGEDVEVSTSETLRLAPVLMTKIWRIIIGSDSPDADPDATELEDEHNAEEDLKAILEDTTPEALDAKN